MWGIASLLVVVVDECFVGVGRIRGGGGGGIDHGLYIERACGTRCPRSNFILFGGSFSLYTKQFVLWVTRFHLFDRFKVLPDGAVIFLFGFGLANSVGE